MANGSLESVVLGAALAEGLQKVSDSIKTFEMEVAEKIREAWEVET